jgi:hypothetical protein
MRMFDFSPPRAESLREFRFGDAEVRILPPQAESLGEFRFGDADCRLCPARKNLRIGAAAIGLTTCAANAFRESRRGR